MDLLKRMPEKWISSSPTQKSIMVVIVSCLILSSYLFYAWATKVEYAPLFTNVQADNAANIVEGLKGMNIPYTLGDAGQTILVPQDQVYEVRLSLASKGLVAEGGPGFELFDTSDMGATDFERNINYQRALQEELRRTIIQIAAVKQARVHLVLPEKSAFIENQHDAQASIVLELKPLASLKPEQVKAIAELVAGSVENLRMENVNIVDTAGHVLSDGIKDAGNSTLQLSQMELKREFEKGLESRIKQMLESIYGSGKVVAMITANLDFSQKEADRVVWGKEGVVASEQLTQTNTGAATSAGVVGDLNRDPGLTDQSVDSANMDMSATKNYEINRVEEKEIYAPGRVISISTAVAINGDLPPDAEMRIKDTISAAIGFDATRGDTINVMTTTFDQSILDAEKAEMEKLDAAAQKEAQISTWMSWGWKGFGALMLLILGFALVRFLGSKRESTELVLQEPASIRKVEEQLEQMELKNVLTSEDEKIKKLLKNQPEVAAQIITTWLEESGGEAGG